MDMLWSTKVLCKKISLVLLCANINNFHQPFLNLVLNEMTIHVNVIYAFMKSLKIHTGCLTSTPNSLNNPNSQVISTTVVVILLCSASAELLKIVACFLNFHATKESPNLMTKAVTICLVLEQAASLSHTNM